MQFDFGQNWAEYSANAVTGAHLEAARRDFARLFDGIPLEHRSFLDIGFGQGFGALSAAALGARVLGCDINPKCREVLMQNRQRFPGLAEDDIEVMIGSVLDDAVIAKLRSHRLHGRAGFDVVHSWGVLHHTGNMSHAIANAASLVRLGGHFVVAIYNRHWSSPLWTVIKRTYCKSPRSVQKLIVAVLYPPIWMAKLLVTGKHPKNKQRGMDFYYDVVDWIGGYPYEYASIEEIKELMRPIGFTLVRTNPANVPTGCNEFVFVKHASGPA